MDNPAPGSETIANLDPTLGYNATSSMPLKDRYCNPTFFMYAFWVLIGNFLVLPLYVITCICLCIYLNNTS